MKNKLFVLLVGLLIQCGTISAFDIRLLMDSAPLNFGLFPNGQSATVYLGFSSVPNSAFERPVFDSSNSVAIGTYNFTSGLVVAPTPFSLGVLAPHFTNGVNEYVQLLIRSENTDVGIQKLESEWLSLPGDLSGSILTSSTFRIDTVRVGTYPPGISSVDLVDMRVSIQAIPEPAVASLYTAMVAFSYIGFRRMSRTRRYSE